MNGRRLTPLGVWIPLFFMVGCADGMPPPPVDPGPMPGPDAGMPDPGSDAGTPPTGDAGMPPPTRDGGTPPGFDAGPPPGPDGGADPDAGPALGPAAACFAEEFTGSAPDLGPEYDRFMPVVGSHCAGTNHQDIDDVERVVFLGDSVTVGTPPTAATDFYRSRLADALARRFSLRAPNGLWKQANLLDGTALVQESGDFASCAKWGARTDDLLRDNSQIEDCFPADKRGLRTLVVMTMGGNDIASITEAGGAEGRPIDEVWMMTREFVQLFRDAVEWLKEPGRFPAGVFVVFANMHEFTDGTGDVSSCSASALAGLEDWEDPSILADMVVWANEQYLSIAVETDSDMVFMLEHFCGHGFHSDDPSAPCYRGPGTERWLDFTCTHPNPTGHRELADMFLSVISE